MIWHRDQLSSWTGFVELVERLNLNEQGDAGWYIRGQSNESWTLQPSLLRQLGEVTVERALGIEFGATRRFTSQYHLHLPADGVDKSQWGSIGWWMVMQHYSCPTRLLDWTLSPYVALYFAVEQSPESDGAVWFFPSSALETVTVNRYGKLRLGSEEQFESHVVAAVYPIEATQHSRRSASQQAVFTICTHLLADHGDVISEAFAGQEDRYPLNKVIIPAGLKDEFLSRLRTMNITPNSLFPSLDGLGRAARDYIRLRTWRTHNEGMAR
ncbi:FRG domain-containing protein [Desulfurivibrio sp. C05AmB]|uniref:FRG domain-containing protein n=1 Tax=Desulfurivibrio sp. C05AmB TaxID=3374371 RepID=UPI00376F4334